MRRQTWFWILLAACAAAAWVYVRAWTRAPYVSPDSAGYMTVGRDLASGGLSGPRVRTPGYPLLLVMTRSTEQPQRQLFFAQLLLQILAVLLMGSVLRSVGASEALTVAAGIVGLSPPFVLYSGYVLTETLTQFCVVLGVVCLQRFLGGRGQAWLIGASFALGYAALTRPTFQIAAVALAALLLLTRRQTERPFRLRDAVVLVAGTVVLAGAWLGYNEARFGVSGSTSALGFNLANRCVDLYDGIPDPTTRRILVEARNEAYVGRQPIAWAHFGAQDRLADALGIKKEQLEPWMRRQMLKLIAGHPVQYAQVVAGALAQFWFPATGSFPLLRERPLQLLWYAVHFALIVLLAFQVLAAFTWTTVTVAGIRFDEQTRRAWTLWSLCATVVLCNALVSCLLETGETRYRAATELLLVMMAGAGVVACGGLFRTLVATARRLQAPSRAE